MSLSMLCVAMMSQDNCTVCKVFIPVINTPVDGVHVQYMCMYVCVHVLCMYMYVCIHVLHIQSFFKFFYSFINALVYKVHIRRPIHWLLLSLNKLNLRQYSLELMIMSGMNGYSI